MACRARRRGGGRCANRLRGLGGWWIDGWRDGAGRGSGQRAAGPGGQGVPCGSRSAAGELAGESLPGNGCRDRAPVGGRTNVCRWRVSERLGVACRDGGEPSRDRRNSECGASRCGGGAAGGGSGLRKAGGGWRVSRRIKGRRIGGCQDGRRSGCGMGGGGWQGEGQVGAWMVAFRGSLGRARLRDRSLRRVRSLPAMLRWLPLRGGAGASPAGRWLPSLGAWLPLLGWWVSGGGGLGGC